MKLTSAANPDVVQCCFLRVCLRCFYLAQKCDLPFQYLLSNGIIYSCRPRCELFLLIRLAFRVQRPRNSKANGVNGLRGKKNEPTDKVTRVNLTSYPASLARFHL